MTWSRWKTELVVLVALLGLWAGACVPHRPVPLEARFPRAGTLHGQLVLRHCGRPMADSLVWLGYARAGTILDLVPWVESPVTRFLKDPEVLQQVHSVDSLHLSWYRDTLRGYFYLAAETTRVILGNRQTLTVPREAYPVRLPVPARPGVYPVWIQTVQIWRWEGPAVPTSEVRVEAQRRWVLAVPISPDSVDTVIQGFRVGSYDRGPDSTWSLFLRAHRWIYRQPVPLVPVRTAAEESLQVSPHFLLGEFLCHEPTSHPRFLYLEPSLLRKLEVALRLGHLADFVIMSGYRTPWYNAKLGNGRFSMHTYGRAADVYVDLDGDGAMDDLNHDGRVDVRDAQWLALLFERVEQETGLVGGIGVYDWKPETHRTPFVHTDVRGFRARWGPWP